MHAERLAHRSLFGELETKVKVFGHAALGLPLEFVRKNSNDLPCPEKATLLDRRQDARLEGVPRRRELLTYATQKRGWNLEDFDVYRVSINYPTLDTLTSITFYKAGSRPHP